MGEKEKKIRQLHSDGRWCSSEVLVVDARAHDDSTSQTNFYSDPKVTNVRRSKRNRIPNTRLKGYIYKTT
jgi:hypothetical protein